MDKHLTSFVNEYKLQCENNKLVYGSVNGYQMCLTIDIYDVNSFKTFIFFKSNDELAKKINDFLISNQKKLKLIASNVNETGIFFAVQTITKKGGYANQKAALDAITAFLNENEVPNENYCPICGEAMDIKELIGLNGVKFNVCPTCKETLKEQLEQEQAVYAASPNNYLRGFLGAAVGGLLGALVWVFVGVVLNMLLAIVAFLISWLAGQGYTKAKGKANYMKIVSSGIVTIVYVVVSTVIVYSIICGKVGLDLATALQEPEIMTEFVTNMVTSLLFGGLGILWSYSSMKKSLHRKQKI